MIPVLRKQFTLGEKERLKSRKAIDALFKDGKRFTISAFRVFYTLSSGTEIKFGTGASTKNFKKAVDRNRIKRLVREAYRLQKIPLQTALKGKGKALNFFFIYIGKELPAYAFVFADVEKVLSRLIDLIDENNS